MGTDTKFGQPDYCPAGPAAAPVGRSKPAAAHTYGDRHDVRYTDQERSTSNVQLSNVQWGDRKGAWCAGYGDRHDVRYTDQERSTCNVQLSTFNGVTERAYGGREWGQTRNLDNRTIAPPDLPQRRSYGRGRLRNPDMGTDTMSDMPVRNVQRETFNSQLSMG